MKIDWKAKLSSRKFWSAVVGFVVPLLLAFGVSDSNATQIAALIMSGGSIITYILGEGLVDAGRNGSKDDKDDKNDEHKFCHKVDVQL